VAVDETTLSVELRLEGPTASIRGTVRGPDGEPVPRAQALIRLLLEGAHGGPRWTPVVFVTDTAGSFVAGGLRAGLVDVDVAAAGLAPSRSRVTLEPGTELPLEVRLGRGFGVAGTVRNADGTPVSNARVMAWSFHSQETYPFESDTDDAGEFRLTCLPPGEVLLMASLLGDPELARRSTKLRGAEGELLAWDPMFGQGLAIRGRAVDAQGAPLAGWEVIAVPAVRGPSQPNAAATDALGAFELVDVEPASYTLLLMGPVGSAQRLTRARLDGVPAGSDEVELVLVGVRDPASFVLGRVLDRGGMPVRPRQLSARGAARSDSIRLVEWTAGEHFRLGPMPAGEYQLSIDVVNHAPLRVPFAVVRDGEHDLGDIQLPAPGRVRLTLRREDGAPPAESTSVFLLRSDRGFAPERRDGLVFEHEMAEPGTYRPRVTSPDSTLASVEPLEVRAGETLDIELLLVPGRTVVLDFDVDAGEALPGDVRVEVRDGNGALLLDELRRLADSQGHDRLSALTSLPLGRATFTARSSDGREARGTIDVAPADDGAMLHVPVRLARPR
jgi:hypothetical protein